MACFCFFQKFEKYSKRKFSSFIQNIGLKQILVSGKLRRKKKLYDYEEESNWLDCPIWHGRNGAISR
jgi:hypothetical protein